MQCMDRGVAIRFFVNVVVIQLCNASWTIFDYETTNKDLQHPFGRSREGGGGQKVFLSCGSSDTIEEFQSRLQGSLLKE